MRSNDLLTCPIGDCGAVVSGMRGLYAHWGKEHPVTREVVKEVPVEVKKTIKDRIAEHDFFKCTGPNGCRPVIDEHLDKIGLKIVKKDMECKSCGAKGDDLFG